MSIIVHLHVVSQGDTWDGTDILPLSRLWENEDLLALSRRGCNLTSVGLSITRGSGKGDVAVMC